MNMTGTTVILLLVAAWLLQLGLSYWQMRRFYRRLAVIRRDGLTAIGMEGSAYKRRVYGVLCVDAAGRIRHAEQLSGWTIFAGLKRVPALEGRSLNELLGEAPIPHMTPKPLAAFRKAAADIAKAREERSAQGAAAPALPAASGDAAPEGQVLARKEVAGIE
ncbi:MAG: transcriptional regulator [Chloroflexi bacterium]|jgi:glucitol operon activator protein|nr:transcriptional regulator GutM [Anaerolineaceae bacterium]NMB90372.1 transcriptional regulator [Chloroflexota bacterium]